MSETFSIASLVDIARTYLAFRASEVQLGALDTCILILGCLGLWSRRSISGALRAGRTSRSASTRCAAQH